MVRRKVFEKCLYILITFHGPPPAILAVGADHKGFIVIIGILRIVSLIILVRINFFDLYARVFVRNRRLLLGDRKNPLRSVGSALFG